MSANEVDENSEIYQGMNVSDQLKYSIKFGLATTIDSEGFGKPMESKLQNDKNRNEYLKTVGTNSENKVLRTKRQTGLIIKPCIFL